MKTRSLFFCLFLIAAVVLSGCGTTGDIPGTVQDRYGIFHVTNDSTAVVEGTIRSRSLDDFQKMMTEYPGISRLEMSNVPGSVDDDTNLQLGQEVYNRGFNTHLIDNGEIASGGVDLFLAGHRRTSGTNPQIGVHSWSSGSTSAADLPQEDPQHQPYIDYYQAIGMSAQLASDFYFFTINVSCH